MPNITVGVVRASIRWITVFAVMATASVSRAEESTDAAALADRVRNLHALARGSTDVRAPSGSLFALDLSDRAAVEQRLRTIDARIASLSQTLPPIATSSTSTTAVPPEIVRPMLEFRALALEAELLRSDPADLAEQLRAANTRYDAYLASEASRREAEAARQAAAQAEREKLRALAEAQRTRSEAVKKIKERRAQIAQVMSALAERNRALSKEEQQGGAARTSAFDRIHRHVAITRETISSSAAPALFAESKRLYDDSVGKLDIAVSRFTTGLDLPDVDRRPVDVRADASNEERAAAAEVRDAIAELVAYRDTIEQTIGDSRYTAVASWLEEVEALRDARVRILDALPKAERDRAYAYSLEGLTEVRREIRAVRMITKGNVVTRSRGIGTLAADVADFQTIGRYAETFGKVLVILIGALWLRRRIPWAVKWLAKNRMSLARSMVGVRRLAWLERTTRRFAPPALLIATLHLGHWWIDGFGKLIEAELVFTIAVWFSYYWLGRVALQTIILWLARRQRLRVSPAIRDKIERSTIVAGRAALMFGLFLAIAKRVLSDAVLYHHGERVIAAAAVVVAFELLRRWRTEVAETYLAAHPNTAFSRTVEASKEKFYGFFVVFAAFLLVAVRAVAVLARETILQFDQIRKALSFLFRKRLERKVEELGSFDGDVDRLPASLHTAFTTHGLTDDELRIPFAPGIDKFTRDLDLWQKGRQKGSMLLRAPRGYGKTTWVNHAAQLARDKGLDVTVLKINRDDDGDALRKQLAEPLGLTGTNTDRIVRELQDGPKRVIVLDDAHHLVLRELGGYDAIDQLMQIVEHTGREVFWLVACDEHTWRYVMAARPRRIRFRSEQTIGEWSEGDIRMLLMARAAASGVVHQFEDLVVDAAQSDAALVRSSESYVRLIWDYADGCPEVACHFWLRSLVYVSDDRVRVRLFSAPNGTRLERLPEEARFVYAALITHDALSAEHVARILRVDASLAEATLLRGLEEGLLVLVPGTDRYRVSVHWYREVVRFLRKHNVI